MRSRWPCSTLVARGSLSSRRVAAWIAIVTLVGCGSDADPQPEPEGKPVGFDVVDAPLRGVDAHWLAEFNDGDLAFAKALREADGLGPLYTRASCAACHETGSRGPGLVQKMAVVEADGVTPATDQSKLAYGHTVHPLAAGGGRVPIVPPADATDVKVSQRLGPPVIGRGYLEAVADAEIERVAAEQAARSDGISGRINYVTYESEPNPASEFPSHKKGDVTIGRLGVKARIATMDDFTADAFQGDMGITSPLRPVEFKNPDDLADDMRPGIDVSLKSVNVRANYIRLLAIPLRVTRPEGALAFEQAQCSSCHAPSLRTRADYPIAQLADVDAPIYSDLLLHDMGAELADGLPAESGGDGSATSFEWRTAPLIGLRFNNSFLHDGRAKSVEQAILLHRGEGSEANAAVDAFDALGEEQRESLLRFVEAL